jgi:hypothetical protein
VSAVGTPLVVAVALIALWIAFNVAYWLWMTHR